MYEGFTSWRAINGASAVLLAVTLLTVLVPESPHWLLSNSTPDAATEVLIRMAKFNLGSKHGLKKEHFQLQRSQPAERAGGQSSGNVLMIVRNREFLVVTLKFFFHWFVASMLYYAFYYALEALSGSVSVNFIIMGALEV